MDKYEQYIQILTEPSPGIFPIASAGAGEETNSSTVGEYTVDKTFDELEALYLKGALQKLTFHRGDGSKVLMQLAYVGEVNGKAAFVFSVAPSPQTDFGFESFALTEDDELLYGGAFACDAMLVPPEDEGSGI